MANPKLKTPKWREEWDNLVGDHKYLVIRNWDEYQVLLPSGVAARWIKDYVNADFDTPLSFFETGVLDRLRRFRGRLGTNIPTNLELILSGTAAMGKDRHCVPQALCKLVASGRLVPSNQQDALSKKSIVQKSSVKPSDIQSSSQSDDSQSEQEHQEPNLGETPNPHVDTVKGKWLDELQLDESEQHKFACVLRWKETIEYWKGKTLFSLKAYRTVEAQYDKFFAKAKVKPHDLPYPEITGTILLIDEEDDSAAACPCGKPAIDTGFCSFACEQNAAPHVHRFMDVLVDGHRPDQRCGGFEGECGILKSELTQAEVQLPKSKAFEIED